MSKRNFIVSANSRSLWNMTLSPGWSAAEAEVLREAVMFYGVGRWSVIEKARVLPGKTPAQLNLQTQRMLGQQSLAEFMGIRLDPRQVWEENAKRQGPEVKRKNGCIVYTGNSRSAEERAALLQLNRARYELPPERIPAQVRPLPAMTVVLGSQEEKERRLAFLRAKLAYLQAVAADRGLLPTAPASASAQGRPRPKRKERSSKRQKQESSEEEVAPRPTRRTDITDEDLALALQLQYDWD